MSVEIVNDCVLFFHQPNWGEKLRGGREWPVVVKPGVTGAEDRQANSQTAYEWREFSVLATSLEERAQFVAALKQALSSGRAAFPLYGRGSLLAADASGTTLDVTGTTWTWAVDDYVFLYNASTGEHRVRQLTGVSGATLTVASLGTTFRKDEYVWPLRFGRVTLLNAEAMNNWLVPARLRFREPAGDGELADSSTCPADGYVASSPVFNVCDTLILSAAFTDTCPRNPKLKWSSNLGADSFKVYSATTETGTYSLVTTVTGNDYTPTPRLLTTGLWWKVSAVYASIESPKSNAVYLAAVRIEAVMRAVQERFNLTCELYSFYGSRWITWPDRTYPSSSSPGHYPADGFYDADLAAIDGDNSWADGTFAAQLVTAVATAVRANISLDGGDTYVEWLSLWLSSAAVEGLASLPVHSVASLSIPSDEFIAPDPSAEITDSNFATKLATMRTAICALTDLALQTNTWEGSHRNTYAQSDPSCAALKAAEVSGWASFIPEASTDKPAAYEYALLNAGSGNFEGAFSAWRTRETFDVTALRDGRARTGQTLKWFAVVEVFNDNSIGYLDAAGYLASAIQRANGLGPIEPSPYGAAVWRETDEVPTIPASPMDPIWASRYYGPAALLLQPTCPFSEDGIELGWHVLTTALIIHRSNLPAKNDWGYFP